MIFTRSCWALLPLAVATMALTPSTDVGATSGERGTWVKPRTETVCSYDRMRISWNINVEEITRITPDWEPPLQFNIYRTQDEGISSDNPAPVRNLLTSFDAVSEAGGQGLVPRSLASSRPMPGSEACSFINPITCFLNGPTCVPSVISIKLDGPERRATLNFDQRTNQAAIPDMEAFLSFFDIDVALIKALKEAEKQTGTLPAAGEAGSAAMGVAGHGPGFTSTWVDEGRTLLATFPDQAFVALYSVGAAGQLSLRLRPHECKGQVFGGHLSLRLSEPGQYTVDLSYASANGSRVSWGPMFEASWVVHACNDYVVQISRPSKADAAGGELRPQVTSRMPAPVLSSTAVLGFNSQRPLKVAHASLPNQEVGSWSMGFWVMLLEGPTGHYRTLFYKGDGHTARTPSAWLLPDSNRLTLRASVEGSADLGSDSVGELPVGAWTHVLLTFSNDTAALEEAAKGEEGVRYAMSLFLNGRHDVSVKYRLPAFANDGMLSIGKDPSNAGPRMLLSQFKIWDRALLRSQAAMEYENTLHHFYPPKAEGLGSRAVEAINVVMASGLGPFRMAGQGHLQLPQAGSEEVLVDVAQVMFDGGEEARASCSGLAERVSLFESAGGKGHARAAYQAANLRLHGEEDLSYDYRPSKDCRPRPDELGQLRSTSLALQDLAHASSHGHAAAARLLALSLLGGVGVWGASPRRSLQAFLSHTPLPPPGMPHQGQPLWAAARSGAHPEFKLDVGNAALRPSTPLAPRRQAERGGESASGQANVTDVAGLALGLLHMAAVLDDAQAQRALAVRYHNGWGVAKDLIAAGYYYEAAADVAASHFHAAGQEPFHEMQRLSDATVEKVEVGQRGEDDEDLRYTIMRAEEGNVPAMITVGDMLYWGARGMPRDHGRALRYFERAAVAGDRGAMCLAAGMYLKGEGVPMNHTRAVELYNEAADGGSVRALNGLGYAYFVGDAVEKNLTKAFGYFERAALIGSDGDSLFNAAHCLEHGHGTEKDLARAAGLYQQAAERFGHFDSAHVLGKLYMDGRVVGQNFVLAIRYLEPASRMGHWGRLVRGGFDRYLARDYLGAYMLYAQAAELGYDVAQANAAYLLDKGLVDIRALVGAPTGGPVDRPTGRPIGQAGGKPMDVDQAYAKLLGWAREALSLRLHWLGYARGGVAEAAVAIGDAYFFGRGGLTRDHTQASYWYSRAGAAGATQGSLSLGYMYEMGLGVGESDWDRAEKHYRQALQADKTDANWVVCSLALARLSIWRRLDRFTLGHKLWQRLREQTATGFMEGLRSRAAREAEPRDVVTRVMTVMRLIMQNATQALQWMDADTVLILVLAAMLAFVLRLRHMRKRGAARRCEARRGTEEDTTQTEPVQEESQ